jgi:hypothetical protein
MYVGNWEIPAYDSVDTFQEVIKRYLKVGITEFLLYYPLAKKQIPMFEQISVEAIPELRNRSS